MAGGVLLSIRWLLATLLILTGLANALPLRTVGEVRALTLAEVGTGLPVELRGVVTFTNHSGLLFFGDATGGIFVNSKELRLRQGDEVEVRGICAPGRTLALITGPGDSYAEISPLGKAPLPEPILIAPGHITDERFDARWSTVDGRVKRVIYETNRTQIEFETGGKRVRGIVPGVIRPGQLPTWVEGLQVTIPGIPAKADFEGEGFAAQFYIQRHSDIRPAAGEVNALFNGASEGQYDLLDRRRETTLRGKVAGQIAYLEQNSGFFLINETGQPWFRAIWVDTVDTAGLAVGQRAEAFGRFEIIDHERYLLEAVARPLRPEVPPLPLLPDQAIASSFNPADAQHGRLLSFEGRLISHQRSIAGEDVFVIGIANELVCVRLLEAAANGANEWPPDATIRATGLWLVRDTHAHGVIPAGFGAQLLLRGVEDLSLVALPPWWTPLRRMQLAATSLALAAVVILWNFMLRQRVTRQMAVIQQKREREVILEERNRMARELHDTLEQQLVGITMQLDVATVRLADSPAAAQSSLDLMRAMIQHSRAEARRSVWDLRSPSLETEGLPGALEELIASNTGEAGPAITLQTTGEIRRMPRPIEFQMFRVAQETVTNAIKHSGAARIEIGVHFSADAVRLEVRDDGKGFNPQAKLTGAHFGLLGIRERASKLDGELTLKSKLGEGTMITLQVRSALTKLDSGN